MSIQADLDIGAIAALGPLGAPPSTKYERLIAKAKQVPAATTLVVHPCDETSLRGPLEAAGAGIIAPILVGPAAKIGSAAIRRRTSTTRPTRRRGVTFSARKMFSSASIASS